MSGEAAAAAAGSAAGAIAQYASAKKMSDSNKRAARAQLAFMREASQWGYGYPEWMKEALKGRYEGVDGRIDTLRNMYTNLEDEYSSGVDFRDTDQALANLRGTLGVDDTVMNMQNLAKMDWNTSLRSLEEIPGMTSGARLAAMSKVTSDMGRGLMEASIAGENSKVQRAGMLYGAESDVAGQKLEEQRRLKQLAMQYGNLGIQMEGNYDAMGREALNDIIGLPNRYPGTAPNPGMSNPGIGTYLAQGVAQGAQDYMMYNMMQQMYGNKQVNQNPVNTGSTPVSYTKDPGGSWNLG